MPDKDVNIHIRSKDTDTTKRDIDGVGESTENLGKKTEQAGKKGAEGTDKLTRSAEKSKGAFGSFMTKIGGWVTALVGFAAAIKIVTGIINANKRAITEHADVAVAQQQKLLRLQYLGDLFKERPELRKEVAAYSEFGMRPFEEVADAWYNLRSKGGALSQQQRDSIMREALEMGRTDPDLPLDTLIDMFSLYAKKTGQADANRIQNVLQQTITEAGGSGADVARHMPRFLPIGMAGELTGPEAAGLWAYATTLEGEAAVATTGLRAVFMKLAGEATPEGEKIMRKLGVRSDMGFLEKIDKLAEAKAAGELPLAAAKQLVGDEGASMLLSLLTDPGAIRATMANVVGVDRGDIDLTATKITELMGTDEVARLEEDIRGLDIQIRNTKGADVNALRWRKKIRERELSQRRRGVAEYHIGADRWVLEQAGGLGVDPDKVSGTVIWGFGPLSIGDEPESAITPPVPEPVPASDRTRDQQRQVERISRLQKKKKDALAAVHLLSRDHENAKGTITQDAAFKALDDGMQAMDEAFEAYYLGAYGRKTLYPRESGEREAEVEAEPAPVPAGDLQGGQSQVINYNDHYDYSINLFPVAGNAEDRLIGPPVDMYA